MCIVELFFCHMNVVTITKYTTVEVAWNSVLTLPLNILPSFTSSLFTARRVEFEDIIDMSESIQIQMELFWSVSIDTDDWSKMMTESILKIHDCLYQPAWKIISATAFVTAVLTIVLQLSNQVRNTWWSIPLHDSPGNCWSADWFIQGLLITWNSPQVLTITRPSITCHLAKSVRMQNWMCTQ